MNVLVEFALDYIWKDCYGDLNELPEYEREIFENTIKELPDSEQKTFWMNQL